MKSNKGFTLIELLAVIVILAIIALIATPIILDVIDTAKKGSAESSALGYIDAVEKQIMIAQVTPETTDDITLPTGNAKMQYAVGGTELGGVDVKGTKPTASKGMVVINSKGSVEDGTCLEINLSGSVYYVTYNGSKAAVSGSACPTDHTGVAAAYSATPSSGN